MKQNLAKSLVAVFFLGLFLWLPSPAPAQTTVELNLGLGYSVVDVEKWYGASVYDWNQMLYHGNGQVYFARLGKLHIGAEAGYEYYFWYSVRAYPYSWFYTYEPRATHVSVVGRMELGRNFFLDIGGGAYFFSAGFTDIGVMGALGYMIKLSPKLSLPIKVRTTVILDDPILLPVGVSAGILYRF